MNNYETDSNNLKYNPEYTETTYAKYVYKDKYFLLTEQVTTKALYYFWKFLDKFDIDNKTLLNILGNLGYLYINLSNSLLNAILILKQSGLKINQDTE